MNHSEKLETKKVISFRFPLFRFIVSVSSYLYTLSVSSMYRFSAGSFPHLSADCVPPLHVSMLLFIKRNTNTHF